MKLFTVSPKIPIKLWTYRSRSVESVVSFRARFTWNRKTCLEGLSCNLSRRLFEEIRPVGSTRFSPNAAEINFHGFSVEIRVYECILLLNLDMEGVISLPNQPIQALYEDNGCNQSVRFQISIQPHSHLGFTHLIDHGASGILRSVQIVARH